MTKKMVRTIGEIGKILKEEYKNRPFDLEVKWDESLPLNVEEKKELLNQMDIILLDLKKQIGNFLYHIQAHKKEVSLTISNATDEEAIIGRHHIFFEGDEKGKTCDYCTKRLECLYAPISLCVENEKIDQNIKETIIKQFNLQYDREKAIKIIEGYGFKKHSIFQFLLPDGYEMETSNYKKDKLSILLS